MSASLMKAMLITCFLTVELRLPLVQGCRRGKTEENSQDNPPLAQLIPALLPTTLCSREGAKNPSQSQLQSLLGFMELQEDLK